MWIKSATWNGRMEGVQHLLYSPRKGRIKMIVDNWKEQTCVRPDIYSAVPNI